MEIRAGSFVQEQGLLTVVEHGSCSAQVASIEKGRSVGRQERGIQLGAWSLRSQGRSSPRDRVRSRAHFA
nr:hypothetical protein CFP56_75923 [Quercus suber]